MPKADANQQIKSSHRSSRLKSFSPFIAFGQSFGEKNRCSVIYQSQKSKHLRGEKEQHIPDLCITLLFRLQYLKQQFALILKQPERSGFRSSICLHKGHYITSFFLVFFNSSNWFLFRRPRCSAKIGQCHLSVYRKIMDSVLQSFQVFLSVLFITLGACQDSALPECSISVSTRRDACLDLGIFSEFNISWCFVTRL